MLADFISQGDLVRFCHKNSYPPFFLDKLISHVIHNNVRLLLFSKYKTSSYLSNCWQLICLLGNLRYPYIMLFILEIFCAATAVISIYIYGNQSWYAPLVGLFSQIFWVTWAFAGGHYPMLLLYAAMILTHIRNLKKMKTTRKLKQKLYLKK